jgi:hypothetical protein
MEIRYRHFGGHRTKHFRTAANRITLPEPHSSEKDHSRNDRRGQLQKAKSMTLSRASVAIKDLKEAKRFWLKPNAAQKIGTARLIGRCLEVPAGGRRSLS